MSHSANNYRILVTGANQGLGFQICKLLARHWYSNTLTPYSLPYNGAKLCIIMACRNVEAAKKAIRDIQESELGATPTLENVEFGPVIQLDLGEENFDPAAVVDQYENHFRGGGGSSSSPPPYLDVLIHNAAICDSFGINFSKGERCTLEGVNQVLRVNFENTVKLNEAFLPVLRRNRSTSTTGDDVKEAAAARVIFMGSRLGVWNYLPESATASPTLQHGYAEQEEGKEIDDPRLAEIDKKIRAVHIQMEFSMETLDPKAKEYSNMKKELYKQRAEVEEELKKGKSTTPSSTTTTVPLREWFQVAVPTLDQIAAVQQSFLAVIAERNKLDIETPPAATATEKAGDDQSTFMVQSDKHKSDQWPEQVSGYGISKLFLHAYARRGAKDEEDLGPASSGGKSRPLLWLPCTPGFCKTSMTGGNGFKTAEEGADTPFWLATTTNERLNSENILSGLFYGDRASIRYDNGESTTSSDKK